MRVLSSKLFSARLFATATAPPLPIVQTPESTRTPAIYVLDPDTDRISAVYANADDTACHFWDDEHVEDLKGLLTYGWSQQADHADSPLAKKATEVVFHDLDSIQRLVRIVRVEDIREGEVRYRRVFAENAANELIGHPVRRITYTNASAATILAGITAGSRWQVGTVEYDGTHTLTFDNVSAQEALRALEVATKLESRYRVEIARGRVTGRYIDLLLRRGADTGKVIEYGKDLAGITRIDDGSALYTAVIPLGRADSAGNRLLISGIAWSVAGGDPMDKASDLDYLENASATAMYGPGGQPIYAFADLPDCATKEALIHAGYDELLKGVADPTYEVDWVALEKAYATAPGQSSLPYGHEKVRLGDRVVVRDLTFDPPIAVTLRVIEQHTSYADMTDAPTLGS